MLSFLYDAATDKSSGFIAGALKIFLFLLSLIYGLSIRVIIFLRRLRMKRLPCKVISVGNVTVGGTGKTLLVEYIARFLKEDGRKVAVVSRGYKRKITNYELPTTNYETMGDEPLMLQNKLGLPVIVDHKRVRGIGRAVSGHAADTVILDDGFQQWGIFKDLDIVAVDCANPFGNRHMLPRGVLREPLCSLKRADCFILAKSDQSGNVASIKAILNRYNPGALIFESVHEPVGFYDFNDPGKLLSPELLKNKTAAAFCGIGSPESLGKSLAGLEVKTGLTFIFPDHYHYRGSDIKKIIADSKKNNIDILVTTEKDAVRLSGIDIPQEIKLFVLQVRLKVKDEEGFAARLRSLYSI